MSGELYLGAVERANRITLRRFDRFFGAGGLCERYERRKDHLIEFGEIAPIVADAAPGLTCGAVRRKFLLSVKLGAFGRRGPRQTIEGLIDLTARAAEPGCYSLRPSYITVEMNPEAMRACRSTWAQWIADQGWPVPAELKTSVLIEHDAAEAPAVALITTGAPGRPTSMHLVQAEMRRRAEIGQMGVKSMADEARYLAKWLERTHPTLPRLKAKSLQNKIGPEWRRLGSRAIPKTIPK